MKPEGAAVAVAADGSRLAFQEIEAPDMFPGVLIPAATIINAARVIEDVTLCLCGEPGQILISMRGRAKPLLLAKMGARLEILVKGQEGQFPDLDGIFPSEALLPVSFTVASRDLKNVTEAIHNLAKFSANMVACAIERDQMTVHTLNTSNGRQARTLAAQGLISSTLLYANVTFLKDAAETALALGRERLVFRAPEPAFTDGHWNGATGPFTIDGGITWVIMPMFGSRNGSGSLPVPEYHGNPAPVHAYAEPLADKYLAEIALILGRAADAETRERDRARAIEVMVERMDFQRSTVLDAWGCLDQMRDIARQKTRHVLEKLARVADTEEEVLDRLLAVKHLDLDDEQIILGCVRRY